MPTERFGPEKRVAQEKKKRSGVKVEFVIRSQSLVLGVYGI